MQDDEFCLDPTRMTLVCGTAGYDGTQFKNLLANEYNIQLNKTSRNSVLLQSNINNTRSDVAHLIRVLMEISRAIDARLEQGGEASAQAFAARVKSLMTDVPDLPNFSRFHDAFRHDAGVGHAGRRYPRRLLCRLRCRGLRAHQADRSGDRPAAAGRTASGVGEFRHPLSAWLPDHGAGPGDDARNHRLHAQARCEGDPRLQRDRGTEAGSSGRAGKTRNSRSALNMFDWFATTLRSYPEIALFLSLAIGYYVGGFSYRGFGLGAVTSTLLAAVLIGQLGITISPNVKSVFFLMFLFAVGYGVGPQFVRGIASDGLPQALFAVVVCIFCLAVPVIVASLAGYDRRLCGRPLCRIADHLGLDGTGNRRDQPAWACHLTRPRRRSTQCRSPTP